MEFTKDAGVIGLALLGSTSAFSIWSAANPSVFTISQFTTEQSKKNARLGMNIGLGLCGALSAGIYLAYGKKGTLPALLTGATGVGLYALYEWMLSTHHISNPTQETMAQQAEGQWIPGVMDNEGNIRTGDTNEIILKAGPPGKPGKGGGGGGGSLGGSPDDPSTWTVITGDMSTGSAFKPGHYAGGRPGNPGAGGVGGGGGGPTGEPGVDLGGGFTPGPGAGFMYPPPEPVQWAGRPGNPGINGAPGGVSGPDPSQPGAVRENWGGGNFPSRGYREMDPNGGSEEDFNRIYNIIGEGEHSYPGLPGGRQGGGGGGGGIDLGGPNPGGAGGQGSGGSGGGGGGGITGLPQSRGSQRQNWGTGNFPSRGYMYPPPEPYCPPDGGPCIQLLNERMGWANYDPRRPDYRPISGETSSYG